MTRYGAIEAGGTKFVCSVGSGPEDLGPLYTVPTTTPDETLAAVVAFFKSQLPIAAGGIASFGPLDLDPGSATYGHITDTPKPGWSGVDIAGAVRRGLAVPVVIDTDVNGAALAEQRWGGARGLSDFVYLTVGTGIGGGAMVNGTLLHGLAHPEMGHMRVPHDRRADPFAGCCPYHGDCLEGLASGPAIARRWGRVAEELPADHEAWELEARYLALAAVNIMYTHCPRRIAFGGGVMRRQALFPRIRAAVREMLGDYPGAIAAWESLDEYIVPPALGERAGVLGAIALAEAAAFATEQRADGS